jgi:DNA topoisomerase-3
MKTLIITEKSSQAKDLRAALGDRFGQILPAEGHLLRLAEPEEVNAERKRWSCTLLKPDGLYPTRPAADGNKPSKLKAASLRMRYQRCTASNCSAFARKLAKNRAMRT